MGRGLVFIVLFPHGVANRAAPEAIGQDRRDQIATSATGAVLVSVDILVFHLP
jgi:hypothetical protein